MGMLAETANVDYGLTFANQGKKFFVFRCRFPYTVHIYIEMTEIYVQYIYIFCQPRRFFFIHYCLLILQTEVCCLSVCLRRNKWKLSVCKRTKQTERTCPTMWKKAWAATGHALSTRRILWCTRLPSACPQLILFTKQVSVKAADPVTLAEPSQRPTQFQSRLSTSSLIKEKSYAKHEFLF